jgi:hypothetical protein
MEDLYLSIARRVQQRVDGLSMVDEDTGQLTESEDGYPVTFPCVLIDASTIDWQSDRDAHQRGTAYITIKHAFDCYEDTHLRTGADLTYEKLSERCRQHRQLCAALHGYQFASALSPMLRTQSRHYTLYGRIKVYETTFSVKVAEALISGKEA